MLGIAILVLLLLVLGGIAWATTPALGELIVALAPHRRGNVFPAGLLFDRRSSVVGLASASDGSQVDGLFQRLARTSDSLRLAGATAKDA